MPSLPPIIDRELLFGDPEISGAQISPDGKYIAFLKPWKETRNIWVKQPAEPFSSARLMTTETAPTSADIRKNLARPGVATGRSMVAWQRTTLEPTTEAPATVVALDTNLLYSPGSRRTEELPR